MRRHASSTCYRNLHFKWRSLYVSQNVQNNPIKWNDALSFKLCIECESLWKIIVLVVKDYAEQEKRGSSSTGLFCGDIKMGRSRKRGQIFTVSIFG
jgi:hypothetical protein